MPQQPTPNPAPRQIPLLDVTRDNGPLRDEMLTRLTQVLDSGRFLHGPDVREAETRMAALAGTAYGVSCASGSDALLLSLMACCVEPGDEVIVPSFTFFATASAVSRLGAKIVFADIDPVTFNIDPDHVESLVTARTKAIIPVHLYGQCAEMDRICEIGRKYSLTVVEDAAQAVGAAYKDRPAGSWGHVACFSFYPTKNIGACGDAGMLTTGNSQWADRLRLLASHGMSPRYFHSVVGINSRLDSMQAAVINVKLGHIEAFTQRRQRLAQRYHELFAATGLDTSLVLPTALADRRHVWNQFTIRVPDRGRDALRQHLADRGVASEIYYPCPLHLQECFRDVGCPAGSLPETEQAAGEVLSLPIFPGLAADEQEMVVEGVRTFFQQRQASAA